MLDFSALSLSCALLTSTVHAQLFNSTIKTTYGPVQGFEYFEQSVLETYFNQSAANVTAFLGIPFAADTAYQNRWKAPQPRESWNQTLLATSFGPPCPSNGVSNISEDCLSLNIWTNAATADAGLPVMVWNQGSDETSDSSMYYGGGMALKDVIFVSFNRRDDAFGYLAHPELNAEGLAATGHQTSGNYGILDFLEVLKWVQNNIANFGGDPDKVTIAGQSFGSGQVYHAINSPLFNGLFRAGISESGIRYPYDTLLAGLATSYVDMSVALGVGQNYTAYHNASTIAELRNLTMEELLVGSQDRVGNGTIWWVTALSAMYPLAFKPVLDGYVLPKTYIQTLLSKPASDVPIITGNNRDESGASTMTEYTVPEYTFDCTIKYGNLSTEYFALYPGNNETQASASWNSAARDTSVISTWAFANEWIKTANSSFYTYYWDHAPPDQTQGAYHMSEIFYALDSLYANAGQYNWTSTDYDIADVMSSYWANFAKTMDPNQGGSYLNGTLQYWTPNNGTGQLVFHVGDGYGNIPLAQPAQVDLIMSYFAQQIPY